MWERIFTDTFLIGFLSATIRMASPILLAAIGEIYSERSGLLNIALEGQMLTGALFGFLGAYYFESYLLGFVFGGISGGMIALILAFMCVSMYASQVVTGVTLNLFCLSLTTYIYGALFGVSMELPRVDPMQSVNIPLLREIPLLGPILFEHKLFVYVTLILAVIAAFFLYRTTVGLKIRAVGEKPSAAETTGVNVYMTRYMCVILAGILAGIGGAILSVGEVGSFSRNMSSGRGFMALAIVIFGGWHPLKAIAASLVFGAATSLQMSLQAFDLPIPSQFLLSFPYIITVAAMSIAAYRSSAPSSLATPYIKE